MRKPLAVMLCCFVQVIAVVAMMAGVSYLPELLRVVRAGVNGQPVMIPELARLVACVCGPLLLGAGLTVGMYSFVYASSQYRQRKVRFPDQPWLWRDDWEAKQIRLSNRTAVIFLTAAILFYLFVLVPLGIYLGSLKNPGMVYTFLVVLALFLLLFIWRQWVIRVRNRSVLHLETLPGRIRGDFSARVTIPVSFPRDSQFHVRLQCDVSQVNHVRPGNTNDMVSLLTNTQNSRSRSDSQTTTVYHATRIVAADECQLTPDSTTFPVMFDIPGNLPSTGVITEGVGTGSDSAVTRNYSWTIRIRLNDESQLKEIVFEIPVFEMSENPQPTCPAKEASLCEHQVC